MHRGGDGCWHGRRWRSARWKSRLVVSDKQTGRVGDEDRFFSAGDGLNLLTVSHPLSKGFPKFRACFSSPIANFVLSTLSGSLSWSCGRGSRP